MLAKATLADVRSRVMFWPAAVGGFLVLIGLVLGSLAVPSLFVAMPPDSFWASGPLLGGLIIANMFGVVGYLALLGAVE